MWVNRGEKDWTVEGHILPQFGFYSRVQGPDGPVEAAIERRSGLITDWRRSSGGVYVNARPGHSELVPLGAYPGEVRQTGERQVEIKYCWESARSA